MIKNILFELIEIKKLLIDIKANQEQFLKRQKVVKSCTVSGIDKKNEIMIKW